jgi:hypothetical protein
MMSTADNPGAGANRLRRLEDIEEIKALKHRYVALIDELIADPGAAGGFVDLFVSDLEVHYDSYGTFTTKETLTAFLLNVISPAFSWGFHVAQNPRIDVQGDAASAEWYLTAHAVYEGGTKVIPFYGRYVDQYVRTGDGWKIKKSVLVFKPPPVP